MGELAVAQRGDGVSRKNVDTIGRQSTLNPISIFVALIFFGWLWGVVGGFLALPMLVIAKAIFDRVPSLNHWAVILSNSPPGTASRDLETRSASV